MAGPVKELVIITKHPEACVSQRMPFLHTGSPRGTAPLPDLLAWLPVYLDPFWNYFQTGHNGLSASLFPFIL